VDVFKSFVRLRKTMGKTLGAQCKMKLFCENTILIDASNFELACQEKDKEQTDFGHLAVL